MNAPDREEAVTLGILEAIEARNNVSQRHLADRLGVALGLANLYLNRCVRKGWVKVSHAPANRYLYYLTPKGFAEKGRLTARYLSISFDLYRRAGVQYQGMFAACVEHGWTRILFCGQSELAELASLRAQEFALSIVGTFEPGASKDDFLRMPLWSKFESVAPHDAVVVTALTNPHEILEFLRERLPVDRILAPELLRITQRRQE